MLFKEKLKSNSKIFLDGGNGSEIAKLGGEMSPAFSALASITSPEIIDATHERMRTYYHKDGGEWKRRDMPRTTFVFLNAEQDLSPEEQSIAAHEEARLALGEYWKALEGTLDPSKVEKAVDNALIGNPVEVAAQAVERFDPDDRLMTWFDFFNHDSARVIRNMEAWMEKVVPQIDELLEGM